MSKLLNELQEKRLSLAAKTRELADKYNAEPAKWTSEDESQWKAVHDDFEANEKAMVDTRAAIDRAAEYQARASEIERIARAANGKPPAKEGKPDSDLTGNALEDQFLGMQAWMLAGSPKLSAKHQEVAAKLGVNIYANAFDIALKPHHLPICNHGWAGLKGPEYPWTLPANALSGSDGVGGGFLKGETFLTRMERAMLAYGGVLQVCERITTATGEPMRWPTGNDTANTGRQIGESAAVTATADPTFGQKIWYSHDFTSDEIKVPNSLLRDATAVDLAGVIGDMLGERLGRIFATKFTTGTGANTPTGIVTAAAAGVTAASATAIAFDELIELEHSIDPSRRNMPGVGYAFHDNVLLAVKKLKDGTGNYLLWKPGSTPMSPNTINDRPYTIVQDMASSIIASAKTVIFGQLSMYKARFVGGIRLMKLVERHAENDQVAFLAFQSGDGNLLNPGDNPVKYLIQHA